MAMTENTTNSLASLDKVMTPKQAKFLDLYVRTGNATSSYQKAYSQDNPALAATSASLLLKKYEGVKLAVMEQHGLNLGHILQRLRESLDATYIEHAFDGEQTELPDQRLRLKAVEVATKLMGMENKQQQLNVGNICIIEDPKRGIFSIGEETFEDGIVES